MGLRVRARLALLAFAAAALAGLARPDPGRPASRGRHGSQRCGLPPGKVPIRYQITRRAA